jgi:hypothetical protein
MLRRAKAGRKRSCSSNKLERGDDSKKSHLAQAYTVVIRRELDEQTAALHAADAGFEEARAVAMKASDIAGIPKEACYGLAGVVLFSSTSSQRR